ncbi:MAG: sigma-70 family RNA polymerase sigma factor [Cyanobacteria bacterium P01_E01_bin.6]
MMYSITLFLLLVMGDRPSPTAKTRSQTYRKIKPTREVNAALAQTSHPSTQHDRLLHLVRFHNAMASDVPPTNFTITAQSTDSELWHALNAGQISALSALYDRYATLVHGLARRILNNPEEAEDITQDVFLKIWNQPHLYDSSRGSLSSFLITMARSRSIDKLRSRGARFRFLQRWQTSVIQTIHTATPLDSASVEERSQIVQSALRELSLNERQVLEISYYEGLSYSETAKRLDIPLGTVKSRARTGLRKLRHALKHTL